MEQYQKKGAIWNTVAGFVDAAEAVIILFVVTRTNGLEDAGVITIAFSIGNLMMTLGKFGMRNYQVTDVDNRYSFRIYLCSRFITISMMALASSLYIGYCMLARDYTWYKASVCFEICVIYIFESLEDVYWGLYQKNNRLDLGAKVFIARWCVILLSTCGLLICNIDLCYSLLVGVIAGAIVSTISNIFIMRSFKYKTSTPSGDAQFGESAINQTWKLLLSCLPLFLVSFFSMYLNNANKYGIDKYMNSEAQACYGFIAMPVFVVSLLNQFIYQPILVKMAKQWHEGNMRGFRRSIYVNAVAVVLLTAICIVGASILGVQVLSWLYATDLSSYRNELLILLFGSGFMAMASFMTVVMTIMRIQKYSIMGYFIGSSLAFATVNNVIINYGIIGACWDYVVVMFVLMIIMSVIVVEKCRKRDLEAKV